MERTTINEILTSRYEFHKDQQNNFFIKNLDDHFSIKAIINGDGIILHLIAGNNVEPKRITIQVDTEEDFATAYSELMEEYNKLKI